MINLLPYEDKKEVEREGLRRFLIVAVFSLSSVFLVCILLMMPVYIFSYQESLNLKREEDLRSEREGLRRFLIVAVFSLSSVFLVCILLMMPVYIFSYQESLNLKREEDLLKQ